MNRVASIVSLTAVAACTSEPRGEPTPWMALVGIERQTFDPGPMADGRDAWLATSPRLVVEASGKIAAPFEADPASPTNVHVIGFFDATSGGSEFLLTEIASETAAAAHGLDFGALLRVTIAQDGGTSSSDILGAASVLVYVSIPGAGPCEAGDVSHASEIDYRLVAEGSGLPLGTIVTTEQTLHVGRVAIRLVVPDAHCDRPD